MLPSQASYLRGCILFFFVFVSYGSVTTFLPLIWRDKGFSGDEIGLLGAIHPMATMFVAPAICALADRKGKKRQVLYVLLICYTIAQPSVLFVGSLLAVVAVEIWTSISSTPIVSLVDSAVRQSVDADGYGKRRTWGALGYGLASVVGGVVHDAGNGGYGGVMIVFVTSTLVALASATTLPIGTTTEAAGCKESTGQSGEPYDIDGDSAAQELETGQKEDAGIHKTSGTGCVDGSTPGLEKITDRENNEEGTKGCRHTETRPPHNDVEEGDMLAAVWAMLGTAGAASFFMAVVLSGMGAGVINTFLFIRLAELGGSNKLMGLARLIMCLAEVPFFYMSGPLINRMGVRSVAALTQTAYIARFLYYSVLREPWWVLPAEVLHGLTFATMWAATVAFAQEIAPVGSRTTVLGLVAGLHRGLGKGLGSFLGGYLYAGLGASLCFRVCTVLPSISLLLLSLPAAQSWFKCKEKRWQDVIGEIGLEGWGQEDLHKPAPNLEAKDRKDRNDAETYAME